MGDLIKFIMLKDETRELYKQKTKALTLTVLACLFVSFINPYGLSTVIYPFKLISQKLIMDNIAEFQSPNFHYLQFLPAKYFLLFVILIIGILKKNLNVIEVFSVIIFTNMALFSLRFIPLFCVVAAPILVRNTNWILKRVNHRFVDVFQKKSDDICSVDASAKGYLWLAVGIFIIAMAVAGNGLEHKFDENRKPVDAVNFLKKVPIKGNMFNDDEFGDYIIYSAHPQYKVFIDSRVDMYGIERLKDYLTMVYVKPGWEKIVEKHDINWAILDSGSIFSRYLIERKDWRLIYSDKVANIFIRNIPENQDIIQRYGNVEPVAGDK